MAFLQLFGSQITNLRVAYLIQHPTIGLLHFPVFHNVAILVLLYSCIQQCHTW
jgi:hypothetical protein